MRRGALPVLPGDGVAAAGAACARQQSFRFLCWRTPTLLPGSAAVAQLGHERSTRLPTPAAASALPASPCPVPAGLLADNNRLSELSRIVAKFAEIAADQRGEVSG